MKAFSGLIRRFSALPEDLRAALGTAANDAASQAARTAQALVPVRTGALRSSIASAPLPNGAAVRASQPYAAHVELGALHSPPQPYLLPAAQSADFPGRAAQAAKEALP